MGVTCYLINCDFDLRSLNDHWASQVVLVVKNLSASTGDLRDAGLIPGSGRSPGGGMATPPVFWPGESHGQRRLLGYGP